MKKAILLYLFLYCVLFAQGLDVVKNQTIDKFLRINQKISKKSAKVGEILRHTITITNIHSDIELADIEVTNFLPVGLSYISKSFKINSISVNPFLRKQKAIFFAGNLQPQQESTISFSTRSNGKDDEEQENVTVAYATDPNGQKVASFTTREVVHVTPELFEDGSWVFGYIYIDVNNNLQYDDGFEPVIPGVKVFMENGQYAITDKNGRYSFDRVTLGTHVLAIDDYTLPHQLELNTKGRRGRTRFAHIKTPAPWRTDFALNFNRKLYEPLPADFEIRYVDDKGTMWQEKIAYTFLFEKKIHTISDVDKWNLKQLLTKEFKVESIELDLLVNGSPHNKKKLFFIEFFLKERFGFKDNLQLFWNDILVVADTTVKNDKSEIASFAIQTNPHQIPADGKTEPIVFIHALNKNGKKIKKNDVITVSIKDSEILNKDVDAEKEGIQITLTKGMAMCIVAAKSEVTTASFTLKYQQIEQNKNIEYQPYHRDWVVIGLGEGVAGIETTKRKKNDGLYVDGRLSFFLRGKIKGEYLLTALYDSGAKENKSLFKTVEANRFYHVYHNPDLSGYEVNSNSRLYVKLEKNDNYIMYGDFNVNFSQTLVSYNHAFRGVAARVKTEYADIQVFGSKNEQLRIRDEIRGQGISGFYRLSRSDIVVNSINIVLEVRNQLRNEEVLEQISKTLYLDYDVDFEKGRILFDSPIASADLNGNPIIIVATYTSKEENSGQYLWGAQADIKLANELLLSGVYIHEGQNRKGNDVYSLGTQFNPFSGLVLEAEIAKTQTYEAQSNRYRSGLGYSFLADLEWKNTKTKIGYHKISESYYSSVLSGLRAGTEKIYFETEWQINKNVTVRVNGEREKTVSDRFQKIGIETVFQTENSTNLLGYQFAEQKTKDSQQKIHVVSVGTRLKLSENLAIRAERHQAFPIKKELIKNNINPSSNFVQVEKNVEHEFQNDLPNVNQRLTSKTILGADIVPTDWFSVWINQEFEDETALALSRTIVGVNLKLKEGTSVYTNYGVERLSEGSRNQALVGAKTEFPINDWLTGNLFFERLQSLNYENNNDFTSQGLDISLFTNKHKGNFRSEVRYQKDDFEFLFAPELVSRWDESITTYWNTLFTPRQSLDIFEQKTLFGIFFRPYFLQNINLIGKTEIDWERNLENQEEVQSLVWSSSFDIHIRLPKSMDVMFRYAYKYEEQQQENESISIMTDLLAARWLYEINDKLDIGLHFGTLNEYESGEMNYSYGLEMGYRVSKDLWLSWGYNIKGIEDTTIQENNFLNDGFYISMRFKFDEDIPEKITAVW